MGNFISQWQGSNPADVIKKTEQELIETSESREDKI